MRSGFAILIICTALVAGCLVPGGGPPPTPNATSTPAQLKYLLLDHYGESRFFYCDPDYYPVARGDEQERAIAAFPGIENDTDTFSAIVARKGLQPPCTNEKKLLVYREYKKLQAIPLDPVTGDTYSFSLRLGDRVEGGRVSGIIRSDGTILREQSESEVLTCPICLAGGTMIDTPSGPVQVKEIGAGTVVWSLRPDGTREAVPVLMAVKTRVPPGHHAVRLRLSDGRELSVSPGHPALDGRSLGSLAVGDRLDGAVVTDTGLVPFDGEFSYDILPAGETGGYLADGIPLKSTLSSGPAGAYQSRGPVP